MVALEVAAAFVDAINSGDADRLAGLMTPDHTFIDADGSEHSGREARSPLVLTFALAFGVFILGPAFLHGPFPPYSSMRAGDVFDLLTPLVMVPLYWLLFRDATGKNPRRGHVIAFLLLAALWVDGHGMHLSANSISNFLGAGSGAAHDLVHFYDEVLSHYLWHLAIVGLSILFIAAIKTPSTVTFVRWSVIGPSAAVYGLAYFLAILEGDTVPLGLPAAILIALGIVLFRKPLVRIHDTVAFFLTGYSVALLLFLGWFLYWRALPQPSEVGLI